LIWPDNCSETSPIHDLLRADRRQEIPAESADPGQGHAHGGHPVAIVLPVCDGVNDLEVAFKGDDDQTDLPGVHAGTGEGVGVDQDADGIVGKRAPVSVVHRPPCYLKHHGNENENAGEEIHEGLVDDERVNAAAELTTSLHQNSEDHGVRTNTNQGNRDAEGV